MSFAVSALPAVIDTLVDLARDAQGNGDIAVGVEICDGPTTSGNPGSRLIFGADGPDDDPDVNDFSAATANQTWAHSTGTAGDEEGDVICTAMAWNNDGDAQYARNVVFDLAEVVAGFCVDDFRLGITVLLWARFGGQLDLTYQQADGGITAVLVFRIHFKARI